MHVPNQRYKRLKIKNGQNDRSGNFSVKPLKIWIAIDQFFVTVSELTWTSVSDCVHIPWLWHKPGHAKSKQTRNEAMTVKL